MFLRGEWIPLSGFTDSMPIKIRVMPDCIIITTQNTRELYGCAEGLSVADVNRPKMIQWIKAFPGGAERYRRCAGSYCYSGN
ncbi:TPA: type I toxin-antitoxin system SymE family toxin [Escherichia coli]|nr:type I toxin-antitoxin system SymE family toxin [Escherichia coli]